MEIPPGLQKDTIDHTVSILSPAFANDAFQRYILLDELRSSGKTEIESSQNERIFSDVVPMMVAESGTLITVPGSTIASVWVLEDHTEEHKDDPHNPPAVNELNAAAHRARSLVLSPSQKILHLVLVANDRSQFSSSKPLPSISALIRPVLTLAKEKGWPVCLEATSTRSRDAYAHLGFEVLEEMVLGSGKVDAQGRGNEGGKGVIVWAMVAGVGKQA